MPESPPAPESRTLPLSLDRERFDRAAAEIVRILAEDRESITPEQASRALAAYLEHTAGEVCDAIGHYGFGPTRRIGPIGDFLDYATGEG